MPGFMGLRGLEHKTPRDIERERREEQDTRVNPQHDAERRSREKVREILRDQDGDMSAYQGETPENADCSKISGYGVDHIMSGRVAVLSFDDTLLTVQGIFSSVKFRHLPVVDEEGRIIGIISDRDFLRVASPFYGTINEQNRDVEIMSRKVGLIMTRRPLCVEPGVTILEAVKVMNGNKISCLPVVEKGTGKLLGIITWKDIVRAFCPRGFKQAGDSNRLRTGVHVNPESAENTRLRAKASESVRLPAEKGEARRPSSAESARIVVCAAKPTPPQPSAAPGQRSDTEAIARPNPKAGGAAPEAGAYDDQGMRPPE